MTATLTASPASHPNWRLRSAASNLRRGNGERLHADEISSIACRCLLRNAWAHRDRPQRRNIRLRSGRAGFHVRHHMRCRPHLAKRCNQQWQCDHDGRQPHDGLWPARRRRQPLHLRQKSLRQAKGQVEDVVRGGTAILKRDEAWRTRNVELPVSGPCNYDHGIPGDQCYF